MVLSISRLISYTFGLHGNFGKIKDIPYKAPHVLSKSFTVLYIPPMILI